MQNLLKQVGNSLTLEKSNCQGFLLLYTKILQARRNRRRTAGIILWTRHRRLDDRYKTARWWSAIERRRSLWCREHWNWKDNEWGRVLFTDESRFSLISDSHRILIWREWEAAIIEHH
ncbi:hypothetical protein TNCV_4513171 [Trichonephila clavipes]|nr:hypothetical protein TNCV_4513171 [Trichonephila clavipes]